MSKTNEIICPQCEQETLLLRKPKYEGLKKVGDALLCSSCGYAFEDEESVPYKTGEKVEIFSDADRSAKVDIFSEGEAGNLCRYCENYVVNPFMQWCALHKKEVEATDSCAQFCSAPDADTTDTETDSL